MGEEYRGDDILKLIDRLEDMVEGHRLVFMNRAWGIDVDHFCTVTQKIRASLPEEIRHARKIHSDQERILNDAREEANRIIEDSRNQASLLVTQDEIARQSTERAQVLISQADQDGTRIRGEADVYARDVKRAADDYARDVHRNADEYAREVLESLGSFVGKIANSIDRGRQKLEEQQEEVSAVGEKEEQ